MTLLDENEKSEFEALYKRLLYAKYGTGMISSESELAFCRELRIAAQAGDVPHGGEMHHVAPVSTDYTDTATIAGANTRSGLRLPQVALLGTLAFALIAYIFITVTGLNKEAPAKNEALPAASPVSTLTAGSTATGLPVPTVAAGFVTVAGEVLPAVRPNTLELIGRSFLVYVAPVKDGNWAVHQDAGVANWIPGSVINWSFALYLDADPQVQVWLAQMKPGASAIVRVADGRALSFKITGTQEISRSQIEFLDPHRPGLTVVIKQDQGDKRLLLQGVEEFVSPADATSEPTTNR